MTIHFELLGVGDQEFLRSLRNENRLWFMDSREINQEDQYSWIRDYKRLKELNLIILDSSNNEKVGFISVYDICEDYAKIGRMITAQGFKHKGYMKYAMIKAFKLAKEFFGIKELILEVKSSNIIARDLYTKMGFITYGFTKDTLIMRKVL
jgi:RimJ/RimL family protein N-acetyltransferase